MIRYLLWGIFFFVVIRLIGNSLKLMRNWNKPPKNMEEPGNRTQPKPFSNIQDADFEDVTHKPDDPQ